MSTGIKFGPFKPIRIRPLPHEAYSRKLVVKPFIFKRNSSDIRLKGGTLEPSVKRFAHDPHPWTGILEKVPNSNDFDLVQSIEDLMNSPPEKLPTFRQKWAAKVKSAVSFLAREKKSPTEPAFSIPLNSSLTDIDGLENVSTEEKDFIQKLFENNPAFAALAVSEGLTAQKILNLAPSELYTDYSRKYGYLSHRGADDGAYITRYRSSKRWLLKLNESSHIDAFFVTTMHHLGLSFHQATGLFHKIIVHAGNETFGFLNGFERFVVFFGQQTNKESVLTLVNWALKHHTDSFFCFGASLDKLNLNKALHYQLQTVRGFCNDWFIHRDEFKLFIAVSHLRLLTTNQVCNLFYQLRKFPWHPSVVTDDIIHFIHLLKHFNFQPSSAELKQAKATLESLATNPIFAHQAHDALNYLNGEWHDLKGSERAWLALSPPVIEGIIETAHPEKQPDPLLTNVSKIARDLAGALIPAATESTQPSVQDPFDETSESAFMKVFEEMLLEDRDTGGKTLTDGQGPGLVTRFVSGDIGSDSPLVQAIDEMMSNDPWIIGEFKKRDARQLKISAQRMLKIAAKKMYGFWLAADERQRYLIRKIARENKITEQDAQTAYFTNNLLYIAFREYYGLKRVHSLPLDAPEGFIVFTEKDSLIAASAPDASGRRQIRALQNNARPFNPYNAYKPLSADLIRGAGFPALNVRGGFDTSIIRAIVVLPPEHADLFD